jgi:pre-60S factor REI1
MKARNAGEAKWAKKQGSSHLDQRKRADFKARIGAVGNNQKRE